MLRRVVHLAPHMRAAASKHAHAAVAAPLVASMRAARAYASTDSKLPSADASDLPEQLFGTPAAASEHVLVGVIPGRARTPATVREASASAGETVEVLAASEWGEATITSRFAPAGRDAAFTDHELRQLDPAVTDRSDPKFADVRPPTAFLEREAWRHEGFSEPFGALRKEENARLDRVAAAGGIGDGAEVGEWSEVKREAQPLPARVCAATDAEGGVGALTAADVGRYYAVNDAAFPHGLSGDVEGEYGEFDFTLHRRLMVREPALGVTALLRGVAADGPGGRDVDAGEVSSVLLDGARGVGKSTTLAAAVQFAHEADWLVVYNRAPRQQWFYNRGVVRASTALPAGVDNVLAEHEHLEEVLQRNGGDKLGALPVRCEATREALGSDVATLGDVVHKGLESSDLVSRAVVALREELKEVTEMPVLIATDQYNDLYGESVYTHLPKGKKLERIAAHRHTLARAYLPLVQHGLKFGAVVAATSKKCPAKTALDVAQYRGVVRHVPSYSAAELAAALEYYEATGVKTTTRESYKESGRLANLTQGNPRELLRFVARFH